MARPNKKRRDDQKAALALIAIMASAGVGLISLTAAAKKYIHHPAYGYAANTFLAALNLAEDLN
jgi:hypothetical protein